MCRLAPVMKTSLPSRQKCLRSFSRAATRCASPFCPSMSGLLLRGARWQRPGEHRQPEQAAGQPPPPAELPFNGVGTLFQGVETGLQAGPWGALLFVVDRERGTRNQKDRCGASVRRSEGGVNQGAVHMASRARDTPHARI